MTTNIQLLRSSVAFKRPSAAPLLDGQAAINLNAAEPGLFWRLTNGQLAKAGPVSITDNGMQPNAAPAGETGNSVGEEWLDSHPALHAPILHVFNGTEFVSANGFTADKSTGNLTLLRQLEVTKIVAAEGQVDGNLVVSGNITPNGQNCAFYLGLPNERWDYLYSCNLDVSFDGKIGRNLEVTNNATIGNNLVVSQSVASDLVPDVDATRHLGLSDKRWIGYFSDLFVEGDLTLGSTCSDNIELKGSTTLFCDLTPDSNNFVSIGSDAKRLKAVYSTDIYTGDLHLKNDKGDWTMIEAEEYLTIRNNNTGKTFRLLMEEV